MPINLFRLPIVLVIFLGLLMFTSHYFVLTPALNIFDENILSLTFFIVGFIVIAIGGWQFRRNQTTVNPLKPENTSSLVTRGLYGYSRNPMYIGFLCWLIACYFLFANYINLLFLPLFVFLANRLYILPEEKALRNKFGEEYLSYAKRVRRWL